eukprot:327996-Prymnesium_polylepis.1
MATARGICALGDCARDGCSTQWRRGARWAATHHGARWPGGCTLLRAAARCCALLRAAAAANGCGALLRACIPKTFA